MGRVTAQAVTGYDGEEVLPKNHLITENDRALLMEKKVDQIKVRSVLTCNEGHGFCSMCFGRDLARGSLVSIGETVGVIAAQSIGEPGTQLTMRTFHVGGTATAGAQVNKSESKTAGKIAFENVKTATLQDGTVIIMNKVGEIVVKNNLGVEKERIPAIYGAKSLKQEGEEVEPGEAIIEWDPFAIPLLAEVSGVVKFKDLIVGNTVSEQVDVVTGLTHKVVLESKDTGLRSRIEILDSNGEIVQIPGTKRLASYVLPVGANIIVNDGEEIEMINIDSLELDNISLIKIDVEGSELNVLQGAKNILTQYKPIIFLSVHPEHLKILGQKTIEINNFLEKHEYKIYYTDESIVNNELKSEEYICISK